MAYTKPSVSDFKTYFSRDFPYNADPNLGVTDADILKAQGQASFNLNEAIIDSQDEFNIMFNYLTAHYLVIDLLASSQGINGQFSWLEQSKSVGSVSQSFAIPQRILDNPYYAGISKTNYGAKYLQLLFPRLAGQMFSVCGRTHP